MPKHNKFCTRVRKVKLLNIRLIMKKPYDKPYSSHIQCSDKVTDKFTLLPKYQFYQTLEFHKLLNNLLKIKAFSVFQQTLTICKNLINNLCHQSSSVALSEWWIPQDKNSLFRPLNWDGYQPYYGKQRNSLKTGCEFYIEEGINWKPNKYLDIAI